MAFTFEQYLSMYSAWYYWKPHTIYLHTNADEAAIARARDEEAALTKWTYRIFSFPNLKVNRMGLILHTKQGTKFTYKEHISDFMRVKAIHDFGGVYIDFDAQPLLDIAPLRKSGFNGIAARQVGGELNSGTFMSKKGGKMIGMWMDRMHKVYNGGWTTHSNGALTFVAESLVRKPGEVLILDQQAMAPVGWTRSEAIALFGMENQNDTTNLDNIISGQPLPAHDDDPPEWPASYLLHAFTPDEPMVDGFTKVTPGYVLNRQSKYARATYPVVRDMYQKGLITIDDL
ncbi:hypothetical protein CCHL11_06169 [Colletotrichum chlorophyti]|uniref:Glycosyl transferase n=1 Tax=Colletotrichum chlorophyti TaxID=708187 RepID=A0A1Q8RTA6_9PEZI|nr:hypothetical protein CCHL11_06169 [Colletotrichum chlorophyti]